MNKSETRSRTRRTELWGAENARAVPNGGPSCSEAESTGQAGTESSLDASSARRIQRALKRVFDVVAAGFLLVAMAPVFGVVALLIRFDDEGPTFYRRRVVGPNGEFNAYKFRTMVSNAEALLARRPTLREMYLRSFKLREDPRVTRVGRFLRRYSVDELPQLVNVLRGEMSLVGPRMVTREELAKYGPYRELLLRVRPGLTGYWQVNGRQKVSYEERVRMDVYYIQNWNLLLDLYLLSKTPFQVIKGEGAY